MNFDRERIPFGISMKPEKRNIFLVAAPAGIDQAAWLRDHWLINCFRLWKNARAEGEPFSTFTDELGIESKCADLPANAQEGDLVTREALFGLRDYVQWQTGEQGWDRVGIPIDVPALDFKADVLLDQALFRGSAGLENSKQTVTLEIRNREGARLQPETVTKDPANPIHSQVLPMPREELIDLWESTRNRIVSAAMIPEQQADNSLASRLATPAQFLHFRLEWPSPYFGLEVCFRWRKPVRPTELESPKEPEKPRR